MAKVYGNRTKEPKVIRRNVLPVDDRSSFTADLATAWSTFGEAKTVLHKLESKTGSPPTKSRLKQHTIPMVTFDTPTHTSPPRSKYTEHVTGHVTGILKTNTSKEKENVHVHVVEPSVLNETLPLSQHTIVSGGGRTAGGLETPVSNPTAVFGPPADFRGSKTTGAKESASTGTSASHSLTTKRFPNVRSDSTTRSSAAHTTGTKHSQTDQVPIRKFELHPDIARALTNQVEQQKLALKRKTITQPSKNISDTRDYNPSGYQIQSHTSSTGSKKRKVASAPPPRSYAGFSSVHSVTPRATSGAHNTVQWKPNTDKLATTQGRSVPASKGQSVAMSEGVKKRPSDNKVRKVHRMTAADVGSGPSGIITTSSWRTGKQLADRILRGKQSRELSPSPPHSSSTSLTSSYEPSSSSLPQMKPGATQEEPLSTWTKEPYKRKFDDILIDLELSAEPEDDITEAGLKRTYKVTGEKIPKKKPKVTSEPTYPAEKVRRYNPTDVKAYMARQKEERRRKLAEERQAQAMASNERQKKLQELYDTQRKRVEVNLRHKQKKREEYAKSLASRGLHIHLHDPTSSSNVSEDSNLPTLTIHPAPRTTHRSPNRFDTGRTPSYLGTSPPSHLHPSPPPHPSPRHSPLRQNRLRPSISPVRAQSPERETTGHVQSSPRQYQASSPSRQYTGHAESSPRMYQSSQTTTGLDPYISTRYSPSPPKSPRSYDERLQVIRASALRLKERIASESKKSLDDSCDVSKSAPFMNSSPFSEQPRYHHQANEQGHPPPMDLPGVHNVHEHALLAERGKKEAEAALKIQSAYRGYNVRKSLKWGQLLAQTSSVSKPNPLSTQAPPISGTKNVASPLIPTPGVSQSNPNFTAQPALVSVGLEPWKQGGGDSHSVINVFTRQHERLRDSLSLLSDQKRDEIRNMTSHHSPTSSAPVITPERLNTSQPLTYAALSEHVTPKSSPSSYTQTFDPEPRAEDVVSLHSGSTVSFSQDSLYSQSSPPRTHSDHSPTPPPINLSMEKQQSPPSKQDTSPKESVSVTMNGISAITPPGSPSFVESFSSTTPYRPLIHVPLTTAYTDGRQSPRSLELQHQAQLNQYETIEENLRHLSQVERARDLSTVQQETVTLAQQLKSQEQTHSNDLSALANKAKMEIKAMKKQVEIDSMHSSERLQQLQENADSQAKEHSKRLAELQQESEIAARESTLRLNEARTAATSAVIEAAQQQIQAAHTMAVSVATAATKEAVKEALKQDKSPTKNDEYESDFDPSTVRPDSRGDETGHTSARENGAGSKDTTLTPSEEGIDTVNDGGHSSNSSSPHEVTEDIDEVSLREHLHVPSESLRRRHSISDSEASPLGDESHASEHSPFSTAGEDSFFAFTSHMVSEYVKEEELRARHRAALLQLREKALQEKTQAQLKWLKMKQKDLRSKGADDLMPPLKKKEKGVMRGFQKEQAEIHRLKQAQETAAHERKLMLLEQQEISKIQKSTQFYRDKIRGYRSRSYASPSPVPSADESVSTYYSHTMTPNHSILSDLSGVDEGRDKSATPSEHLEPSSFPTYSPSTAKDVSTHQDTSQQDNMTQSDSSMSEQLERSLERSGRSPRSVKRKNVSPLAGRKEKSVNLKHLRKLASSEAEKYLAQRELTLQKKRQTVEATIRRHRELLKKDRELDKEEASVNKLVDKAMEMLRQTPLSSTHSQHFPREPSPPTKHYSMSEKLSKASGGSVTEELSGTESIAEEMFGSSHSKDNTGSVSSNIPSEYAEDTFESLGTTLTASHQPHLIKTSTPSHQAHPFTPETQHDVDESLDNSLRASASITDSLMTTTSSGSGLEARIRALKDQLRQRKEEVKNVQNEQRRKKKAILKQQEEQLKKKLEAVDLKANRVTSRTPPPLILSPDTPSPYSGLYSHDKTPSYSENEYHTGTSRESSPEIIDHTPASREQSGSPVSVISERTSREISGSPVLTEQTSTPKELSASPIPEEISLRNTLHSPLPEETTPLKTKDDHSELYSYTPFTASKDLTLTPHTTEIVQTELEDDSEDAPTVSDGLESKIGSVEALVPPPGFEEPRTQISEAPPTHDSTITEQVSEHIDMEKSNEINEDNLSGTEGVRENDRHDDFEPELLPEHADGLDTRSDTSLPISESKGGDSEEESNYQPGQHVLVGGVMEGVVRFVGKTQFAPGVWIGVEFSESCGRNNGSIGGHRYFDCPQNHGVFAPPKKVRIIEDFHDSENSTRESSIDEELEQALSDTMSMDSGDKAFNDDEYTNEFEPEQENRTIDEKSLELSSPPDNVQNLQVSTENISEHISELAEDSVVSEQQAPAEFEVVGEKPDSLPSAPENLVQQLQHAAPTPAPPPEFAEGASREGSTEPPPVPEHTPLDRKPDKISDELAQELMNEAYETMHQIRKSKQSTETEHKSAVKVVQVPKDKVVPLCLDEKADLITDQLLSLLLQSESSLMNNIRSSKKVKETETEPSTPPKRQHHLRISISNLKECSPPPLSPPSPYRIPPVMLSGDYSPPTSPPCHLSTARAAVGEKSLFAQQESSTTPAKLERTSSTESIVQLLDTIKLTTAQCMVPSERPKVDDIVKQAWETALGEGLDSLHSRDVPCPENILNLFMDIRELSPEEEHCHKAYIQLVFDMTMEVIRQLHPIPPPSAVWLHGTVLRRPLGSRSVEPPSLDLVQKRVYAALIRGQLPAQLPTVRFLHGKKRPGGKDVDFVDGILIKELRFEEPSWIDYHKDETTVKIRTADSILDSLLSEAVQIMCDIEQKKRKS